jgi:hypothetical protein
MIRIYKRAALICALVLTGVIPAFSQARIILNGGVLSLQNGGYLVVQNAAPNAITRNNGYIQSFDDKNIIKWMIGTTSSTYVVPWGSASQYLPLSFTTSGASGIGYLQLGTYSFSDWNNANHLPTGVTHFNNTSGTDHSAFSIDRFWRIEATGYTLKPNLSQLIFAYGDNEISAAGNTITETMLRAERWNSTVGSWTDAVPQATVNSSANTVTVASLAAADFYPWWNLSSGGVNKYWVSSANGSWNNAANWSFSAGGAGGAGVPTNSDAVIFDGTHDGSCVVNSDVNVSAISIQSGYAGTISQGNNDLVITNDLIVQSGNFQGGSGRISTGRDFNLVSGVFTSTSDTLSIANTLTFSGGTFSPNGGVVKFTGSSFAQYQMVQGALVLPLNHLHVDNGQFNSQLLINGQVELNGVLTLANGAYIDADGGTNTGVLTMRSTTDGPFANAAIAPIPSGATFVGNVTVQRFMSLEGPNNSIYRYIGSPLSNATVSDIQNEIPVSGSFAGTSQCSSCSAQSMFEYQESVINDANGSGTADKNDGYIDFPQSSNTEMLQSGKGYAMYIRGTAITSARWDVRGTINKGNITPVTLPVSYTSSGVADEDGWNLVSNPYASTIDWASDGWTKQNLQNAVYTRDNGSATGRFASYNGVVGANGGSQYIALGQAFWVKGDGNGTPLLQANENVKAPYQPAAFFRDDITDLLRLAMKRGVDTDEIIIHFRDDATSAFDVHADAWKMFSSGFNLSSLGINNEKLSINSWSALICSTEVKLSVDWTRPGSYTLDLKDMSTMQGDVTITLVDKYLNSSTPLIEGASYPFTITTDPNSAGQRFIVQIAKNPEPITIHQDGMMLWVDYKSDMQWYHDGVPLEGANFSHLEIASGGNYSATVNTNGCTLSGAREVVITGVEQPMNEALQVYPNPFQDRFRVRVSEPGVLTVFNSVGQVLTTRNILRDAELDLSSAPSGLYIIKISTRNSVTSRAVVKE